MNDVEKKPITTLDWVRWTSQAGGHTTTKEGIVRLKIFPGEHAYQCYKNRFGVDTYATMFDSGLPRKHESYLVQVDRSGKKPAMYWPRVSCLELIDER